jgi:DNA-binding response OmpR family regulator
MTKNSIHILIIDDDSMIRRLFGGVIANAGFEVLYSQNGNEGREVARRMQPDLILLDIRMPDTDGYVIARRLREEPKTSHIPIIFLTNEDISAEAEKAVKEMWVEDYIHKSIDLKELVKRIKKVLLDSNRKKK